MCCVKGIGDLDAKIKHHLDPHRLTRNHVPKGLSFQEFHGDERSPIGFVDFVDGTNVRVVQGRRGLGFPLKPAEGLRVVGEFVGKELQSDVAAQLEVLRLVHNTHPAPTQLLHYAVVRDGLADHCRESYVCGTGKSMKALGLAVALEESLLKKSR